MPPLPRTTSGLRTGGFGRADHRLPGMYRPLELYNCMQISSNGLNGAEDPGLKNLIQGNRFLASLPDRIIERVIPCLRETDLKCEDCLSRQDEKVEWVYFPLTAVVSEFQMLEDGRTIEVALVGNEGVVAASLMLSESPAINNAEVYVAGKALRIKSEFFDRRLLTDEAFARSLHTLIESQMKRLSQRLICTTFHSMEQRLCTWLLRINDRTQNGRFEITHEHIARSLGVHRPSISATLQALRDKGLFDYKRARMKIQNLHGLAELACSCYSEDGVVV